MLHHSSASACHPIGITRSILWNVSVRSGNLSRESCLRSQACNTAYEYLHVFKPQLEDFFRSSWSEAEILCMKREALVLCLEAAQQLHSKLWGRTSVEIAYEVSLIVANPFVDSMTDSTKSSETQASRGVRERPCPRYQDRSCLWNWEDPHWVECTVHYFVRTVNCALRL